MANFAVDDLMASYGADPELNMSELFDCDRITSTRISRQPLGCGVRIEAPPQGNCGGSGNACCRNPGSGAWIGRRGRRAGIEYAEVAAAESVAVPHVVYRHPTDRVRPVGQLGGVNEKEPDRTIAVATAREETRYVAARLIVGWMSHPHSIHVDRDRRPIYRNTVGVLGQGPAEIHKRVARGAASLGRRVQGSERLGRVRIV